MHLFDTHTHFDVADFDEDRQQLALEAKSGCRCFGINRLLQSRFDDLVHTHHQLKQWENVPTSYLAPGCIRFILSSTDQSIFLILNRFCSKKTASQ